MLKNNYDIYIAAFPVILVIEKVEYAKLLKNNSCICIAEFFGVGNGL